MSRCQGSSVHNKTYTVVVRSPKPFSTRILETWIARRSCFLTSFLILGIVAVLASAMFFISILFMRDSCNAYYEPGMALEILSIRNMTAYPTNSSTGTTLWQVDSAFNIGLSTRNPIWVAGCVTTHRRVHVRVEYRGQTILWQEVPLGFKLQPQRSRQVLMKVEGKNFLLEKSDLGPMMEAEIRNRNVVLDVYFDVRYLTNAWYLKNHEESKWSVKYRCMMVATLPSNSSNSWLQQICHDLSED